MDAPNGGQIATHRPCTFRTVEIGANAPGLHDIPYGKSSAVLVQDVLQSVQLKAFRKANRRFIAATP
ncbi:hypothetical protein niasHT_005424 [Heterodera trifolii]|uniref:Uncharacterized protein n=1 Tax=Heterodera trifolii TaxID=157864 RepID=A0ABD2MF91_9BILA